MPGGRRSPAGRVVDLALGGWLNQIIPRVLNLASSCPLARLFGVRACLQPFALAPGGRGPAEQRGSTIMTISHEEEVLHG
jgi:hypothetical protein